MSPSILLSDACTTVGEITKPPNLRTHFCKDVIVYPDDDLASIGMMITGCKSYVS